MLIILKNMIKYLPLEVILMINYKWDNNEITKRYFSCLKDIIKTTDEVKKNNLLIDLDNLKDMIIFSIMKLPNFNKETFSTKKYLDLDREFIQSETSFFQRNKIESLIPKIINAPIKLINCENSYKPDNMVEESLIFLDQINPKLRIFLENTIKNKQLLIKNNLRQQSCAGETFSLTDCSYFKILLNSSSNAFITLNHEIIHGYVNRLTKNKYEKPNKNILYREVASLLTELYANEYLFENKLINYDEFVSNFQNVFIVNSYYEIELIDILFILATNTNYKNNYFDAKKIIKEKLKSNPNYDIKVKELTEFPLKYYLIYLYSSIIAINLYNNFKKDSKNGLKAAIDIMSNITLDNEEKIFKDYDLNLEKSLDEFIKENNSMVLKNKSS